LDTIQVVGDLVCDNDVARVPGAPSEYCDPLPSSILRPSAGGAWYLEKLIGAACDDLLKPKSNGKLTSPRLRMVSPQSKRPSTPNPRKGEFAHACSVWAPHPATSDKSCKEKVWRIADFLGCKPATKIGKLEPPKPDPDAKVLVLDDANLGFRDAVTHWRDLLDSCPKDAQIVLKTCSPLAVGPLWDRLCDGWADQLTVVLPVAALRARGASITRALSWELLIEQLELEFHSGASSRDLARASRLVVALGGAGVAIFRGSSTRRCRLERCFYDVAEQEGTWGARYPGRTFGATSILAAVSARALIAEESDSFFMAANRAIVAIRAAHQAGGGPADGKTTEDMLAGFDPERGFLAMRKGLCPVHGGESRPLLFAAVPREPPFQFMHPKCPGGEYDLLQAVTAPGYQYVAAKAVEVVREGAVAALTGAPRASFGKYLTVDRQEIERINELRRLIHGYVRSPEDKTPLSFAVFGPPGSGKSFAIKELIGETMGGDSEVLEFNLSQFQNPAELHTAFHKVRDATVMDKVPLVFWDEFDSENLRWLKEFLAPMQDSVFRAGPVTHPFGKSIFVFAGGVRTTFQEFDLSDEDARIEAAPEEVRGEVQKACQEFRDKKGPDFVSRLRGYVNIKGPNPVSAGERESSDVAHVIRRAVMLRSQLERFYPQLFQHGRVAISPAVLRAFLRVRRFRHGARSLEVLVRMSQLVNAESFGVDALPSPDLLSMHATPDFLELLRQDDLLQRLGEALANGRTEPMLEILAQACHKGWWDAKLAQSHTSGDTRSNGIGLHPDCRPWNELSPESQENNRRPVSQRVLALYDLGYQVILSEEASPINDVSTEHRERLAALEHEIWLRGKLVAGWDAGKTANAAIRRHTDIIPFDELPPDQQELNRAITLAFLQGLNDHGYSIVRRAQQKVSPHGCAAPASEC